MMPRSPLTLPSPTETRIHLIFVASLTRDNRSMCSVSHHTLFSCFLDRLPIWKVEPTNAWRPCLSRIYFTRYRLRDDLLPMLSRHGDIAYAVLTPHGARVSTRLRAPANLGFNVGQKLVSRILRRVGSARNDVMTRRCTASHVATAIVLGAAGCSVPIMSAPEVYSIAQTPITCHAFNADRSRTLTRDIIFPVQLTDDAFLQRSHSA